MGASIKKLANNLRLLVFAAVLMWAFAGTLLGLMARSNIFSILSISFLASTVFNYLLIRSRRTFQTAIFKINFKTAFFGMVGYFYYNLFFGLAMISYGTASEATILNYTWPFFTILFTILMFKRQRIDVPFVLSTFMGLSGVFLLVSRGDLSTVHFDDSLFGLLFGLLTGLSYGLFSAFSSRFDTAVLPKFLLYSTFLSCAFMGVFAFIYYGQGAFNLSISDLLLALAHGLLLDSLGHIFWTRVQSLAAKRQKDLSATVSLVYYLPVISLLLISLILKEEQVYEWYFSGAIILITASALLPIYYRKYLHSSPHEI